MAHLSSQWIEACETTQILCKRVLELLQDERITQADKLDHDGLKDAIAMLSIGVARLMKPGAAKHDHIALMLKCQGNQNAEVLAEHLSRLSRYLHHFSKLELSPYERAELIYFFAQLQRRAKTLP